MRAVADPKGRSRPSTAPAPTPPEVLDLPDIPEPPEYLGEVGRRVWAEVWAAGGQSYRQDSDHHIVERYASLQERRLHLLAMVTAEGFTTVGSTGQLVAHPAAKLLADVESKLVPLEDRLGLSPESRVRLGIQAVEHRTRLDAFLDGD